MKTLNYSTLFLSVIIGYLNCSGQNLSEKVELPEIKILNSKIDSLLNVVIEDMEKRFNSPDNRYLLYIMKQDSDYNIHISITSKRAFDYAYHSGNSTIQGFCIVRNQDVLIIEAFYPQIMERSNRKKTYTFFNIREKYKKEKVPPPPPMSNSITFDFLLKNGNVLD